jgi:hypothetical protein
MSDTALNSILTVTDLSECGTLYELILQCESDQSKQNLENLIAAFQQQLAKLLEKYSNDEFSFLF